MKDRMELLQGKLELLEAGEPLEASLEGLAEDEVELLKLAANLREMKAPKRNAKLVSAQRRQAIEEASALLEGEREPRQRRWLLPAFAFSGLGAALLVCGVVTSAVAGFLLLRRSAQPSDITKGPAAVASSTSV